MESTGFQTLDKAWGGVDQTSLLPKTQTNSAWTETGKGRHLSTNKDKDQEGRQGKRVQKYLIDYTDDLTNTEWRAGASTLSQ